MRILQRLGLLAVLFTGLPIAASAPASARSNQISGVAVFDFGGTTCKGPPAEYADFVSYPPLLMSGSLDGCWYTRVDTVKDNGAPSGVYLETGREVFVGSLDGGAVGVIVTTYRFESKWDPDVSTGAELRGRCQHPIVAGSGSGGFIAAIGRVDFKDVVADGSFVYRGHISTP